MIMLIIKIIIRNNLNYDNNSSITSPAGHKTNDNDNIF